MVGLHPWTERNATSHPVASFVELLESLDEAARARWEESSRRTALRDALFRCALAEVASDNLDSARVLLEPLARHGGVGDFRMVLGHVLMLQGDTVGARRWYAAEATEEGCVVAAGALQALEAGTPQSQDQVRAWLRARAHESYLPL